MTGCSNGHNGAREVCVCVCGGGGGGGGEAVHSLLHGYMDANISQ